MIRLPSISAAALAGVCAACVFATSVAAVVVGAFARVIDQIWWIECGQGRLLAVHDPHDVRGLGAVAAEQAVVTQEPEVAGFGDGLGLNFRRQ